MTCTHAGIFSPTHHFLEVKFPCLCGGGGGVLPCYPHFPEVKFLCVWWGGGGVHFYDSKQGHEATETGLAYAPVSQAHGHNHIVQCIACSTAT